MLTLRGRLYPVTSCATIIHALCFSSIVWYLTVNLSHTPEETHRSDILVVVCKSLLFSWPIWTLLLWRCREGHKGRIIIPLILGVIALLPGILLWYAMANFNPG
jgi:hypothetical protein